jgi:uncharacterized membrane protein YedE/YeeE
MIRSANNVSRLQTLHQEEKTSMTLLQIFSAVLIGLGFGYVLQGPQICYNRAYRTLTFQAENTMFRSLLLAMLIQMIGWHLLVTFEIVQVNIVSGIWLAALVGGFFFGFAFVFAQGCSTTMWYRVGSGNIGSLITLLGFGIGEVLTFHGFLRPFRDSLTRFEVTTLSGRADTLPNLLGVSPWLLVIPIGIITGGWLVYTSRQEVSTPRLGGWPWPYVGLSLGILGVAAWVFSQGTDWAYGLGVVGATGPIIRALWLGPEILNWGSVLVLSLPIGGFIAAWKHGTLRLEVPEWPAATLFAISGLIMGISAALAGGCNIGHTFTGAPTLALSSLLASLTIYIGALAGNWLRFTRLNVPLPDLIAER